MLRRCDICGEEQEEKWMQTYNTGRRTMWLCWECYQESQRQADLSDLYRGNRLHKMWMANNKRSK